MHAQYILGLQVPVGDPLPVQEVQRVSDLPHDLGGLRLWEMLVLLDAGQELAAVDLEWGDTYCLGILGVTIYLY